MIDVKDHQVEAPSRRRWVMPAVIATVASFAIGLGFVLADRHDRSVPTQMSRAQLADISTACTTWMDDETKWGPESRTWCNDMTGWMDQQMANGSMTASMWGDRTQMRATCRSWMMTDSSIGRRSEWCDAMIDGAGPHMNGGWDEWTNGPMLGRDP